MACPCPQVLYSHGLVLHEFRSGTHSLHMAVRAAALACLSEQALEQIQSCFVIYVITLLDQWAPVYITPAWQLPLSLAREHGPDITAAFELAGKLTKNESIPSARVLKAILSMDVEGVRWLTDAVGQPPSSTWQQV